MLSAVADSHATSKADSCHEDSSEFRNANPRIPTLSLSVSILQLGAAPGGSMARIEKERISFETPDHCRIVGDFYFENGKKSVAQPCVVLVHEFKKGREQWNSFAAALVSAGYKVLAYDVRGHGESANLKDVTSVLSDPQLAPFDFDGAVTWLTHRKGVDAGRLASIGVSFGAYVACGGNADYREQVKATVAISCSLKGALTFLSHKPGERAMHKVLYMAGKGQPAKDAAELSDKYTSGARTVKIFDETAAQGIDLLNTKPEAMEIILEWLNENL